MTISETSEITSVLERVQSWPAPMRIALAHQILETVTAAGELNTSSKQPRGYSAEEVRAMLKIDKPAPDDATVKQWIEEHRLEKYGK